MKKLVASLFAVVSLVASAAPWQLRVQQENGSGDLIGYFVTPSPGAGNIGVLRFDGSSNALTWVNIGTGLLVSGSTLSLPNTGTAGTYSGVTTDALGRVTSGTNRSFIYTTRALNTCFQVSSTRDALVNYAVDILTTLTLVNGQAGTVYLEIFTDSGCTLGTQEVTRFVNGQSGSFAAGLSLNQNVTGLLTGVIPSGAYVKLRTQNNAGTPTFTARPGQEVLM